MQIEVFGGMPGQKRFIAGQPVISATQTQDLYVLLAGKVDEYDTSARLQETFGPGRCFNARAFFFGDESATYIAHTDILVQVLTRQALEALLQAHPVVAVEMLREAFATRQELSRMEEEQAKARTRARLQARVQAMQTRVPTPASAQTPLGDAMEKSPEQFPARNKKQETLEENAAEGAATASPPPADDRPVKTIVLQGSPPGMNMKTQLKESYEPAKKATILEALPIPSFYLPAHRRYQMIWHPEYDTYVFPKQMNCPCCGAAFEGKKVFQSKLISISQPRYDLRQFYKDFEPIWYELVTCPACYFSTFLNLFLEPKNFSKSIAAKKLPALRDELMLEFGGERTLEFVFAAHYLALQCADSYLDAQKLAARLWGNISWLYEDVGEKELERLAAQSAAKANEKLYLEGRLIPAQEQAVAMTIAGMLHRAGETGEIKRWLFEVKKHKAGKRLYTDLADDLLQHLRETES